MNSRQLSAFRAIMQQGSMSDAARHLGVSQPAISRLIRDLEQSLGFSLFERRNSRLHATPGARALYREVRLHFIGLETLERAADRIRTMKTGRLRLAAVPSLAQTVLPGIIAGFSRGRDDVAISLDSGTSDDLLQQIAGHRFDLALIELPAETGAVSMGAAFRTDRVCVAPAGHRFADQARVRVEDLEREAFIPVGAADAAGSRRLERLLRESLVRPDETLTVGQDLVALAMVREGLGVALVDPFSAQQASADGFVTRPFEPALPYCIGIVQPAGRDSTPLEQAFVDSFVAAVGTRLAMQPIDPDEAARL